MSEVPPSRPVRTRFAPSPTGALHIGGVRTALFAWAFARKHGGEFILRIEDTDRKRSSDESLQGIVRDLEWLGLMWDEGPSLKDPTNKASDLGALGPYRQSDRLDPYREHIDLLLKAGRAYVPDDEPEIVRFRMDRDIAFKDEVYGDIKVEAKDLEDFVIRKADGFPTFHLAVTVDDALMRISHVIRGQEHLTNTTKHVAIFDALAEITGDAGTYQRPVFVHLPSIMNPDGSKMSKRDKGKIARKAAKEAGLTGVEGIEQQEFDRFLSKESDNVETAIMIARHLKIQLPEIDTFDFEKSGYLPEPLLNYLALLGWNPGNDLEKFSREQFVELFSFARINRANSKFDREKLKAFNADYLQSLEVKTLSGLLDDYLLNYDAALLNAVKNQLHDLADAYRERLVTLSDISSSAAFFKTPPATYDDKAAKKNLHKNDGEGLKALDDVCPVLEGIDPWTPEAIHAAIEAFTQMQGYKNMGSIAQPLRVAITGTAVSPPIDLTLAILGRDETLRRIRACLQHFADASTNA
ncbi:MAG: glutamate--tRNA ligase family protein [Phycisphaeraceae bacterium]